MFKERQAVICINNDFIYMMEYFEYLKIWEFPEKGRIYTVRAVVDDCLLLNEIVNTKSENGELLFYQWHFRPLNHKSLPIEEEFAQESTSANFAEWPSETLCMTIA